jgi:hypothetical protein
MKHLLHTLFIILLLVAAPSVASAQILYEIDFSTYANGDLAGQGDFEQFGTNATNPIQVVNGAVVIPAGATEDGQDVVLPFGELFRAPTSGFTELWIDISLDINEAAGANPSYFLALNTLNTLSSADGNFANARLAIREGNFNGFRNIGARVTGQSGYPFTFATQLMSGSPRMIRMAVIMNAGNANDEIYVYVDDNLTSVYLGLTMRRPIGARELLHHVYSGTGSVTDPVSFGGLLLSQFANATVQQSPVKIHKLRIYLANVGTTSVDRGPETVGRMELEQNYPNPFNPSTVIGYQLAVDGEASLKVYDVLGREVAVLVDGMMTAGQHQATFNADGLPSGMYLVRLEAGGQVMTRKMSLVK